ncbi:enoyl-CoA hydratase/isomerase family protein [Pseudoalteromonas sp. S3178]|uniref:enoyl-CoA hydratase/isomerase family protein n=1 Tax=Pseudoalteromonas sp. S3178 TaxID=579532 RepID=UPI00110ACA60|nr:enoyl-CoA hydratase/isomerase family protein [Pseudoalteromonas sp. S3178]TMP02114.1 enoyl-CoA hydratase/isomerase family protein [Pseudoalteromonas sp. S3178]
MTALIEFKNENNTAILTMNTAENRHNPAFLAQLNQHLDNIESNQAITSVVLTSSSDKNWSLGIDLQWMSNSSNTPTDIANFMLEITQLLKRIVTFPMPIIAALNGHTYGNGAVLACACDFRFMKSDKGFFCFPEVDVLVPFVPSMIPIIHKAIPHTYFNRLAMSGQRVGASDLLKNNVIEEVFTNNEDLQAGVLEFAQQFNKNRWIYAQNKTQINKQILQTIKQEDPAFIENISKLLWKNLQKK